MASWPSTVILSVPLKKINVLPVVSLHELLDRSMMRIGTPGALSMT
jgi:hypothetical protein